MPRCTTSTSSPSRLTSRYLPARRIDVTACPRGAARNSALFLWRRTDRLPFTSTVLMRRPTTSFSRSRRIVSTSGSSGIAGRLGSARAGSASSASTGGVGGRLLGVLLRATLPGAAVATADEDPGHVGAGVVGPGPVDVVARQLPAAAQDQLLEAGLEVLGARAQRRPRRCGAAAAAARGRDAASQPPSRYTAPMMASIVLARIEGLARPPELSSPLTEQQPPPEVDVLRPPRRAPWR